MNGMKRLALIAAALIVAAIAADMAIGLLFDHLSSTAAGGDTRHHFYVNRLADEPVMVFGSSRASHHYNSAILEDSLGMRVYNCGTDGNGILLATAQLHNILSRGVRLKLVIYDLQPPFDIDDNGDLSRPLEWMRTFSDMPGTKTLINLTDPSERIKLLSNAYRYNTKFLQIISDNISPRQTSVKGFRPLQGQITTDFPIQKKQAAAINKLKTRMLSEFIHLCDSIGAELIFVVSPHYHAANARKAVHRLAEAMDTARLRIIDFSTDTAFTGHKELFTEPSHLNSRGADLFTRRLIPRLRALDSPVISQAAAREDSQDTGARRHE